MGIIGSWWGSRRESDHWGDLGVDGCIIMGCISGEFAVYSVLVVKLRERVRWGDVGLDGWIKLGWVCWVRAVYRFLEGKLEGKRPLGRPRRRCVYDIRIGLTVRGCIGAWWGTWRH